MIFSGTDDQVVTDHRIKPKITTGGKVTAKVEYGGFASVNGSLTFGVFSDNYTGIGAEFGVNAGISASYASDGILTAGLGIGLQSNTQSGVDATPYASLSYRNKSVKDITASAGLTASFGYNTRSGAKGLTLAATYGVVATRTQVSVNGPVGAGLLDINVDSKTGQANGGFGGTTISYNTEPIQPSIQTEYKSTYDSFSFDVGPGVYGVFPSLGGTGYRSVREIKNASVSKPAYGFLYAERGKNDPDALMDFIREKDNPIVDGIPNIGMPIHTPDLWSYTSQEGSGQFRLFRRGTGAFFDNQANDESTVSTTGGDIGAGAIFHGGVTHYDQKTSNSTHKWTKDNDYLKEGDFANPKFDKIANQGAYFKLIGEKNIEDKAVNDNLKNSEAVSVALNNMAATDKFDHGNGSQATQHAPMGALSSRRPTSTTISYLTAEEAAKPGVALENSILNYPLNEYGSFVLPSKHKPTPDIISRTANYRRPKHISEMTVTDGSGKRMVYGIPVYNIKNFEYTFAVNSVKNNGGIIYPSDNIVSIPQNVGAPDFNQGVDHYYQKESKPAYATSYLLTGILSPDYVDRTGDGISDDDPGTAIKFNYSKINGNYNWRSPYSGANLNKCLRADPDDDKASVIYGEKELWYASSIESKTKIVYFITDDRADGKGVDAIGFPVADQQNGTNASKKQRRLREIRLYSKADMSKPIKVVKFGYETDAYTLCPGVENSSNGKLKLSKVWFEYGNSTKGAKHPYTFDYNTDVNGQLVHYGHMMTDRWGTYKDPLRNAPLNLSNEEFPYSDQDPNSKTIADESAALWHLKRITLPTGGIISVNYESGDYAFVQNKRAMVMVPIRSLIPDPVPGQTYADGLNQLSGAKDLFVRVNVGTTGTPSPGTTDQTEWFRNNYLNGSKYLYTKIAVDVATDASASFVGAKADFVPCYSEIAGAVVSAPGVLDIKLVPTKIDDQFHDSQWYNPLSIATWQRIKNEYPRYAYPGYDNSINQSESSSISSAIGAIIDAAKNLSELKENFYKKAKRRSYGTQVDLSKSFVRIVKKGGIKRGGGARVKTISISDQWNGLDPAQPASTPGTYGQSYEYLAADGTSSGVASYEPAIGNDENPLKQPIPYSQSIKGGISNFFNLEEPFGESLYPAPSIVYSRVVVKDLDPGNNGIPKTGYSVNEFYTAKDFPVRVTVLPITRNSFKPESHYSFLETNSVDELCLSQGYSIELNDMHGKPKATHIFNSSNAEIASTVYNYNTKPTPSGETVLNNEVTVISQDGSVSTGQTVGQDIDFFSDFREQESINHGRTINIGVDVIPFPFFIPFLPIPHFPINTNNEYKLFRSACAVKVIQSYGILGSVTKTVNGSSNTSENLAYDGLTGDVLLTKTQNEFKQSIYSVKIPAYWAYAGMGPASQNLGAILSGLKTDNNGQINDDFDGNLVAGDELIDLQSGSNYGNHYWIVDIPAASVPADAIAANPIYGFTTGKYLMDNFGRLAINQKALTGGMVKVVRSSHRNMLGDGITNIVSLTNPIQNGYLKLADGRDLTSLRVINASASTYDENWPTEAPEYHINEDNTRNWTIEGNNFGVYTQYHFDQYYFYEAKDLVSPGYYSDEPYFDALYYDYYYHTHGQNFSFGGFANLYWATKFPTTLILPSGVRDNSPGHPYAIAASFNVDHDGSYMVGYESVHPITIQFNCENPIKTNYITHNSIHYGWNFLRVNLTKGKNTVYIGSSYRNAELVSGVGLEVYDNDENEVAQAGRDDDVNIIFSTKNLVNRNDVPGTISDYMIGLNGEPVVYKTISHYAFDDPEQTPVLSCSVPAAINPYVYGFKGNWRPYQTKVFQQNRVYASNVKSALPVVGVSNSGYINQFAGNWYQADQVLLNKTPWVQNTSAAATKWTIANTITLYDQYGQQLENVDALGRASAAKFDFNGELPSAVASNALNREIYHCSFEDNKFAPGNQAANPNIPIRQFVDLNSGSTSSLTISNTVSHTGNYSAYLADASKGLNLSTIVYKGINQPSSFLDVNANYQFVRKTTGTDHKAIAGLYPNGFEPTPASKKYMFDVWVKDAHPTDKSVNIDLKISYGNNNTSVPLVCKAMVEDWKLLEGTFDISNAALNSTTDITLFNALNFSIVPKNGSDAYIDDIRIHPKDSHMKTYAYDDKTMRLMAELDENGFATFYEYDDEGLLVRVKKETEKGIVTLKESRSSYRKQL